MKKQNGITLIALVITIVIMVILGGISVYLVLDQNGVISRAKSTKVLTEETQANEQIALEEVSNQMEELIKEENIKILGYDNPYIPTGFTHTEGTWNDGYVIQDGEGNEFVWVPCVLDQSKVKEGDTVVTFEKTLPTTTNTTDPLYKYNDDNLKLLPKDTGVMAEDSSVDEIRTSVGIYGGFYIARYQAGIVGTLANISLSTKTSTDGSVKPLSKPGVGVWNYINSTDSITVAKAMIDNSTTGIKSTLISGECWDTTLQWMVNASDNKETNIGYDINSAGKGWYSDVASNTIHTTGYYAVNRIYDMAGNVWEWTTENCINSGSNCIVNRGGSYGVVGSAFSSANRDGTNKDFTNNYVTFRVVLYK